MLDIVLVEDDARLGTMVSDYLQRHGYQVAHERSGERAVARILAEKPALVLLDVGLPDQDGFEVCRQIRPLYDGIICVLTARTDNIDQVLGLSWGRRLHRQTDRTTGAAGAAARPPAPPPPGRTA